ncbi:MAG: FliH/SctL family protein [Porticoccaceae bacterium]
MSDDKAVIERWQVPFFETPQEPASAAPEEIEAEAQARGFKMGQWQGMEAGREQADRLVRDIEALLEQMTRPFAGLDQTVTRELTRIAMTAARHIVRRELILDSEVVCDLFAEAVATLSSVEGAIEVFVNPRDRARLVEFSSTLAEPGRYRLIDDASLSPGGCRIKTPISFVDASVEQRMDAVFSRLEASVEAQLDG